MEYLSLTSRNQEKNNHKNKDKQKEEQETRWCSISEDLLSEILSYLVAGDEAIFRSVCKTWRRCLKPKPALLPSPFCDVDNRDHAVISPWLCLFPTSSRWKSLQFFHPIHNETYLHEISPQVSDSLLYYSRHGWLLLGQAVHIFFFNLFTKQIIDLPDLPRLLDLISFTSVPTSPDCLVVGIYLREDSGSVCTYKFGEEDWKLYSVPFKRPFCGGISVQYFPAFHDGFFYWVDRKGCLLKLDPNNPVKGCVTYKKFGFGLHSHQSPRQTFMLEKQGDLLAVTVPNSKDDMMHVYKWDNKKKIFVAVESLGDYVLFVSPGESFAEKAIYKGMSNKIFPPTFFDRSGTYAFYSLGTRSYHSFSTNHPHQSYGKVSQICNSFWFRPMPM